jgi:phosphatidylserine/phosphatidylglycerophosphate/cardiolipin synthase-like enzyme
MELLHEPRMARKIQNIVGAKREILVLTAPSFVRSWTDEQTSALSLAAKSGITVKIFLNHRPLLAIARLKQLSDCGVEVRSASRRWLGTCSSTEDEIWIFDRECALGGNRDQSKELKDQPHSGRLSVECLFARAPAKTAAKYFDQRWEGHPEGTALVVRHQEFSFRGGKGAEKEFLVYASRARKEICLCLTDVRISPRLYRALLAALKRGVILRVYANSFGIKNIRNRIMFGSLLRAGAVLRFTAGHQPLDSSCALFDQTSIYLGALPGSVRSWFRTPRPVFFLHDRELASSLAKDLERQVSHQISRENSGSLIKPPPIAPRRALRQS